MPKRFSPARCGSASLLDHARRPPASHGVVAELCRRAASFDCQQGRQRVSSGTASHVVRRLVGDSGVTACRRDAAASAKAPSGVDRDVPGHRPRPARATRGSPGTPRGRTRPRRRRACTRRARCPRASARRRRGTRRPSRCALHRVERAIAGRRPLLEPVGERLRPPRVREPEADDGDRRLVVVLLEEHPLEHLRPLVAVGRARSACPRRSTRGSRRTRRAAARRRGRASARAAPGSARRAAPAGPSGRRRRPCAARTRARGGRRAGGPCSSCPRPGCRREARRHSRRSVRRGGTGPARRATVPARLRAGDRHRTRPAAALSSCSRGRRARSRRPARGARPGLATPWRRSSPPAPRPRRRAR